MEENAHVPAPQEQPEKEILTDKQIARAVHRNSFPTWLDILAMVGMFLLSQLLIGLVVALAFRGQESGLNTFFSYVGAFVVTIAFALVLTKRRAGTTRNIMHFSFKGFNPAMILWGLILMLATNVVIEPLVNLFPSEWYDMIKEHITTGGWATVTAVVMAPICEEIFFRGIIQDSLVRKRGPWAGILIASAIFGIIHGIPQQVVAGFCLGIIIGFVYYKTQSLLSVIILHAINNALATFMTLFETEENVERTLREMLGNDTLYWVIFAFCALLLIFSLVGVLISIRKGKERQRLKAEENSKK